jgi:ligand-binding SRPBCC domain-containing protein
VITAAVDMTSVLSAPQADVWARIGTPEGINDELRPIMKMTVPRGLKGQTLDTVPLGKSLGRSWFLLFNVLPIDYDRIVVAERDPGERFLEDSTMSAMKLWRHERTLRTEGSATVLRDQVSFQLRPHLAWIPGLAGLLSKVLGFLFTHRHKRLVEHFGAGR